MSDKFELDEADLKIIRSLSKDPRKAVTQLARDVGVSRPTLNKRLNNLIDKEIIRIGVTIDIKNLGFHVREVGLKVKGMEDKLELRRALSKCPRVLMLTCPLEEATLSMYVFGEDMGTLRSVIESLKEFPYTNAVYMSPSDPPAYPKAFRVELSPDKANVAPCGRKCSECFNYRNNLCIGCPAVIEYRGPL